ncbi:hypothetical protein PHMEG_0002803 [Phytophthora megakarya]|uniref:Uncharacterized protein n=1 Tax=Phytophthora megakarya TaxID=4795 RepID=A0A225WZU1_9STRA|nr:hypothetical protein PHMEG_0002803 [Phytophthora megakarya]
MAKVYGKRYAGREKWLFAELTKRYGAAKVSALKAQYESGSGGGASTTTSNSDSGKSDQHPAQKSTTSDHPKTKRQGHPRHPQFFHPPTPASNVDLSGGIPSAPASVTHPVESDPSHSQSRQEAEGAGATIPNDKVPSGPTDRVSPGQRDNSGNISAFSGPPPSIPTPHDGGEGNNAATVGTEGPPMMNGPPRSIQREERIGQLKSPPPPPPSGMDSNNAAPLGLRQRHNTAGPTAHGQQKTGVEPPAVTLEGLLKELYKTHQPDKLKNVSIVAKQYAGKERELVGLLKGKYGALSVKHLEENLDVLERAHRARTGGKNGEKKRGCFIRMISLMFWLSVLLYFSFGAVFVSFVVLDAWECHTVDSDDQELEAEECVPLKKELKTFTYERVADYMSQSHPEACFCLEWKTRESALFTTLSGDDLVSLMRLVPFSPESFGASWIGSVKEQVPSQEFYDSYAKPVVDLSLDVGSFVWTSVLELAGYEEGSDAKVDVVKDAVGSDDTADILSLDHGSESDEHANSLEELSDEVENESFVNEVESANQLSEEVEAGLAAEVETTGEYVSLEQIPVVEEVGTFGDELETDEIGVAKEEESIVENIVNVEEDATIIDGESSSFGSTDEEYNTVESTEPVESENAPVEEAELADADDADFVGEAEVTETMTKDDGVIGRIEEAESVDGDNEGVSASIETDVVDAMIDEAQEVSNFEVEGNEERNEEASADENVVESDDIVEVEVHQEGLDLSYPESEVTEDEQVVESVETSADDVEVESESVVVEDVLSEDIVAEMKAVAQSEDAGADGLMKSEAELADAFDLPTPGDGDAELTESESDIEAARDASEVEATSEASEVDVESADLESSDSEDLEVEGSSYSELKAESESAVDGAGVELSILADVDASVQGLEDGNSASSESVAGETDGDTEAIATEVESEVATPFDEVDVAASGEGFADVTVEEELTMTEGEIELASISNDVDETNVASEESTLSSLGEDVVVVEKEAGESDEHITVPVEAENADGVASNDMDESDVPVDVDAAIPEADVEIAGVSNEILVEHESEFVESKEKVDETFSIPAEIDSDGEEEVVAEVESTSPSEIEAESMDGLVDEDAAVENEVDLTTLSETDTEQSASEVEVASELVEESVAIEGTERSVDTDAADIAEDVSIDDVNIAGSFGYEDVDAPVSYGSTVDQAYKATESSNFFSVDADEVSHKVGLSPNSNTVEFVSRDAGSTSLANSDNDDDDGEDEEIAFMEELEDPDEVLRMAEQAAAAELSMDSR